MTSTYQREYKEDIAQFFVDSYYAGGAIAEADLPRYLYTCQEQEPLFAGLFYYNRPWYDSLTGKFAAFRDIFRKIV